MKERWDEMKLDAMIAPCYPHSAFKHEDSEELAFLVPFYSLWNVLQYPAGVVPVTEVLETEQTEGDYEDDENDILTKKIKHSMVGSAGMPIGVQVVTPKWKDEECLALMKILGDSLNFLKKPDMFEH